MTALGIAHAYQPRAHHRRQRKRDQQAHHDRDGCGDAKLIKEPTRYRRHERYGQEDHDQRQSGSQHGQTNVFRRFTRRFFCFDSLFLNEAEDVLQYDDRIVDHHADRLAAYQISISSIRQALERQNTDVPGGNVNTGKEELTLRTLGRFTEPRQFADLVIANVNGAPVRLRDLGRVEDGTKEIESCHHHRRALPRNRAQLADAINSIDYLFNLLSD